MQSCLCWEGVCSAHPCATLPTSHHPQAPSNPCPVSKPRSTPFPNLSTLVLCPHSLVWCESPPYCGFHVPRACWQVPILSLHILCVLYFPKAASVPRSHSFHLLNAHSIPSHAFRPVLPDPSRLKEHFLQNLLGPWSLSHCGPWS